MVNKALAWFKKKCYPGSLILMYHRVNGSDVDPWGSCVQPNHFAEQLEVLRKEAVLLSLREFVARHQERRLPRNAVAITFDDGYTDNLSNAQPLVERYEIPATVFVTSGYVGSKREFWWDELEQLLLGPTDLPATLELMLGTKTNRWQLGQASHFRKGADGIELKQKAWEGRPGSRHHLFYEVWQTLQPLDDGARWPALDALAAWSGVVPELRESRRPLREAELRTLARCDLIEIGAHSVTHPFLPAQPLSGQTQEIHECKAQLERWLDSPVTSFAYPHGEYSKETLSIVKEAGFISACTTLEHAARPGVNCFELPRFQVEDWDGDAFSKRLRKWFRR
jgi:peptidoglycan/xylan/chitin deacetylase (PgdA/CDA1 family)